MALLGARRRSCYDEARDRCGAPLKPDDATACSGVLIAEDDAEILGTLTALLEDEGYRVIAVRNGHEALSSLRTQASAPPCMILLDLMMPRMDGIEFRHEQLRDPALAPIPVVLLTADPNGRGIGESMKVAASLRKPVDLDQLLALVGQYCGPPKAVGA